MADDLWFEVDDIVELLSTDDEIDEKFCIGDLLRIIDVHPDQAYDYSICPVLARHESLVASYSFNESELGACNEHYRGTSDV